jgi:transcription termination factor NusA
VCSSDLLDKQISDVFGAVGEKMYRTNSGSDLMTQLAGAGVHTRDDLADLAVDELTEISGLDEGRARDLIMKAREHWFTT